MAHGARALFIVDDNITLNIKRFEALCRAIVEAGLNHVEYMVQGMTSTIAQSADTLAPLMREAGFRYVFLGIENVLESDLGFLKASAKNAAREHGRRTGNATLAAIDALHRNGMYVVGGLIVGNPGDTREAVEANLEFARRYVDWPYIQHPTPYPATPMTRDLRERGLIVNERLEEYDGTTAVVRSESLSADEIEFLRWQRERWMKVRHFPAALLHSPGFVLRHGRAMLAPHLPREQLAVVAGPGGRARGLRPLPGHPPGRARGGRLARLREDLAEVVLEVHHVVLHVCAEGPGLLRTRADLVRVLLRGHAGHDVHQVAVVGAPQLDQRVPRLLVVALHGHEAVAVVGRELDVRRELAAHEALVVVAGGVDEVSQDLPARPGVRRAAHPAPRLAQREQAPGHGLHQRFQPIDRLFHASLSWATTRFRPRRFAS